MRREGRLLAEGYRKMKLKAVSGIMLTLLLVGMLILTFNIQPIESGSTTCTVDDNGPADFSSIQEAIDAASSGDTVYVYNGTYYEHVVVNRTVSLLGENKETTIIDGNATGTVVSITANNVFISGFIIQNSGGYPSSNIRIVNSSGNNITQNIIRNNNDRGIYLDRSMNNTISGNDVFNTFYGILIGNTSTCNIISNNSVSSNAYGIYLYDGSKNNFVSANNVSNNNNMGIFLGPVPAGGGYLPSYNNTVCDNIVSSSGTGIMVGGTSFSSTLTDNVIEHNNWGIYLQGTTSNTLSRNNITDNNLGIYMDGWCDYTNFYHNNFINNSRQVNNRAWNFPRPIYWDYGYPSGGNYWSNYSGVDLFSGSCQNETGSDGIGDTPYVIDENNRDNYPLMKPWSPAIAATIDLDPDTLNLKSKGRWITVYIELPENYNVSEVDRATILLNGTIPVDPFWVDKPLESVIGDYDNDIVPDLMVKFNRAVVIEYLLNQNITYGNVTLAVTGELYDGTLFEGSDMIMAKMPGKAIEKIPREVDSDDEYVPVMPEFPSFIILPLFMVTTLLAVIVYRRKHSA